MRIPRLFAVLCLLVCTACAETGGNAGNEPRATQGPVATPDESAEPDRAVVRTEKWADLKEAMALRAPEGDDGWYVVKRAGQILRYDGEATTELLDISSEVSTQAEEGLLDLVFSPDGDAAYLHFTGTEKPYGDNHIRRYDWDGTTFANPREILVVEHPYPHHNAGQLQFGPDGFLYITIGDGGTETLTQEADNGDPHDYGKDTSELLGNILRIDPARTSPGKAYAIPDGNPFDGEDGRDEIWAYGLRNPWRFSFDRQTGDLWLPDVGHRYWEEINVEPAGSEGGRNYGWSWLEGLAEYKGDAPEDVTSPVFAYPHRNGHCAIIGGFVYRGAKIPDLVGDYVFGDFCSGALQSIRFEEGKVTSHRFLGPKVEQLVSFAEDRDGELFALSYNQGIFRVEPAD